MAKNLSQILKGLDDIDDSYLLDKTDSTTGQKYLYLMTLQVIHSI